MLQIQITTQRTTLGGTSVLQQRPRQLRSTSVMAPRALFGRKSAAVVVEEPPAPAKRGLGLFGRSGSSTATTTKQQPAAKQQKSIKGRSKKSSSSSGSKSVDKAAEYTRRQGFLSRAVSALDFAEVRSQSDAELLYDAKYGKRDASGKMTKEQYGALRRRVVGTAKDYWKDWVDVKGEYTEKGYVAKDRASTASAVPGLPFLIATVVALLGATAFVVAQTS